MNIWVKILWMGATVFSTASLVWFILGSTAMFQRSLDLISTVILICMWLPTLVVTIVSIRLLVKGWSPSEGTTYIGFIAILALLLVISVYLFQSVNTHGWLTEQITSDSTKVTVDEKYEYRVDLINVFQRNSHARLYLNNVATGEKISIPVDIPTGKIIILGIKNVNNWVMLEPTDVSSRYILYTTEELGLPEERFEIDIGERTSKRF